jgi:hypothetical protein
LFDVGFLDRESYDSIKSRVDSGQKENRFWLGVEAVLASVAGAAAGAMELRAARAAALAAKREELVTLLHYRQLGLDPAKGKFVYEEFATAVRLQRHLGQRLDREATGMYDWISRTSGKSYDAVRPGPPEFFNPAKFTDSIYDHLYMKSGLDKVVIDMTGFSRSHIAEVEKYLATLPEAAKAKIIRLGF